MWRPHTRTSAGSKRGRLTVNVLCRRRRPPAFDPRQRFASHLREPSAAHNEGRATCDRRSRCALLVTHVASSNPVECRDYCIAQGAFQLGDVCFDQVEILFATMSLAHTIEDAVHVHALVRR